MSTLSTEILPAANWRERVRSHRRRLAPWVEAHRDRRARAQAQPVIDFLFTYYSHRPGQLLRWSPGFGTQLQDADADLTRDSHWRRQDGAAFLDIEGMASRQRREVFFVRELLAAIGRRPGRFTCFGLHEWAMVYRLRGEELRHSAFPLRLAPPELAEFVEGQAICCSHYDAFRFFTPEARALNSLQPGFGDRLDLEQPGCLHTNMDLYKWAYKLSPWIPSELVADAFLLAAEIRELDMRASPYDLSALGHSPIAIETESGRMEYERLQRGFADRAEPLRRNLHAWADRLASLLETSRSYGETRESRNS